MTKTELIHEMSKVLNSSKEAKAVLESLLATITDALKTGVKVTIAGFGTFKVSKRKARTGRNPQTGAKIKIASKKVAQFIPGKHLKNAIK